MEIPAQRPTNRLPPTAAPNPRFLRRVQKILRDGETERTKREKPWLPCKSLYGKPLEMAMVRSTDRAQTYSSTVSPAAHPPLREKNSSQMSQSSRTSLSSTPPLAAVILDSCYMLTFEALVYLKMTPSNSPPEKSNRELDTPSTGGGDGREEDRRHGQI